MDLYWTSDEMTNIRSTVPSTDKSGCSVFATVIISTQKETLSYLLHGAEFFLISQPVNFAASQEIPRIYGTRKFLTLPTSARHLSLS
jgi:hypothetical protein